MKEKFEENAQFLSAKEVSRFLSIPLRTVQRLSEQGKIRAIKIGNKWKYSIDDIIVYRNYGTSSPIHIRDSGHFIEHRAYPRINCNLKCLYSIDLHPFKNISSSGIIKNLGAGGIFLLGSHIEEIEIDDPVKLQFVLSTEKETDIEAEGRVVRKDSIGLGIKFRKISSEDKNRIIQYIG